MNAECHIWVSSCVVLTYSRDKNFEYIHLTAVHLNIETTNQDIIQNHLSRVYLFLPSIYLTYVANLFVCFKLNIEHSFCYLKTIPNLDVMSSVVELIMDNYFDRNTRVS